MLYAAHLEDVLGIEAYGAVALAVLQLIEHGRYLRAEECRDDRRRRLVGAQTVGVGGAHDRRLQHSVVAVYGSYDIYQKRYELQILRRRAAGADEVDARVGADRPVAVLARAVDALEGFLVQQHAEIVAARDLIHDCHQQLVVVVGQIDLLVDRSQLELVGRHFVVARLQRDAEHQAFVFEIAHERHHALGNGAEIVILQLLVLGRLVSHERTAGKHQIGAHSPQALVDEKVLLLPAQIGVYPLDRLVEVAAHLGRGAVDSRYRPKKRHLIVERIARIGDEDGRDT